MPRVSMNSETSPAASQPLLEQIDKQWEKLTEKVAVLKQEQGRRDDEERAEHAKGLQEIRAQREREEAESEAASVAKQEREVRKQAQECHSERE